MSSPLDGRIRSIAREEAVTVLGASAPSDSGGDRVTELEKQVAALTARVARMEQTPTASADTAPKTRRTSHKAETLAETGE